MNSQQPVVLISGASRGIGRDAADYLARYGCRVFAGARQTDRAAVLEATGQRLAIPLEVVQLDVDEPESIDRAVQNVLERAGRIDVLINNAAIGYSGPIEEQTDEDIRAIFETNVLGSVRLIRAVLPGMRERRSGHIINISSVLGRIAPPFVGLYAASKWALEAYSEALRAEVHPFGIRVNIIEPGFIMTDFGKSTRKSAGFREGRSPYQALMNAVDQRSLAARNRPSTPNKVSKAIYRVIRQRRAPFRVVVGLPAQLTLLGRKYVPEALYHAAVSRITGSRLV